MARTTRILGEAEHDQEINVSAWVNDKYVRQAFKERGLDYDKQLASFETYNVTGTDPICNAPVHPGKTGEIWIQVATSSRSVRRSARCWA